MQHRSVCHHVQFEVVEERVMMSAGVAHPGITAGAIHSPPAFAAPAHRDVVSAVHAHSGAAPAAQKFVPVKGTIKGGPTTVVQGNYFVVGNLSGKLGKVAFSGHANGFFSGNTLQGGYIDLTNSQGTVTASLGEGTLATKGNTAKVTVVLIFENATGAYSLTAGSAGDVTLKFSHGKSHAKAIPDSFAWFGSEIIFNVLLNSPDIYDRIFNAFNPRP